MKGLTSSALIFIVGYIVVSIAMMLAGQPTVFTLFK